MRGVSPVLFGHRQPAATHGRGHYEYRYRIASVAVDAKLRQQKDRCAICNRAFADVMNRRRPALDHNHKCCPTLPTCGKCNRGILCDRCNVLLGIVEGLNLDLDVLFGAVKKYLWKWKLVHRKSEQQ